LGCAHLATKPGLKTRQIMS